MLLLCNVESFFYSGEQIWSTQPLPSLTKTTLWNTTKNQETSRLAQAFACLTFLTFSVQKFNYVLIPVIIYKDMIFLRWQSCDVLLVIITALKKPSLLTTVCSNQLSVRLNCLEFFHYPLSSSTSQSEKKRNWNLTSCWSGFQFLWKRALKSPVQR